MKHDLESLKAALHAAPTVSWKGRLTRRVAFFALTAINPPNWLYTSGKPNRFNPAGVDCIYFSLDPAVARIEFENLWRNNPAGNQPATDFHAEAELRKVLDLTSPPTLRALKIQPDDLLDNWRLAKTPTLTQLIGRAVDETKLFSAICYRSSAAARRKQPGKNLVIFRDCLRPGEFVRIVGTGKMPLQSWP